jgi:anti-sigma-K factor RskA
MSTNEQDLHVLAGEYVLGVLSDAERDAVEARLATDGALRAAVKEARERFLELDLTAASAPAPAALWEGIEQGLAAPAMKPTNIVSLRPAAPAKASSAGFWKGAATASLAASLLVAVAVGSQWQRLTAPRPAVIVVLLDAQSKPGAIIEAFADDSVRVVPLENFNVPADRVIQLWTLPDAKTGPVSIGLLPQLKDLRLTGPNLPKPKADQLYEFTLEPAGGSPTGKPTGPILVKGFAKLPI